MAGVKKIVNAMAYWMLPMGIQDVLRRMLAASVSTIRGEDLKAVHSNTKHKNIYSGRRCFILCNGESVATQDLSPLKHEIVFSVSQGYLLKQYELIKPQYHCSPQFTRTELFTEKIAIEYLKEMEALTGDAEIFLSTDEKKIVEKNNIFVGRAVNFLNFDYWRGQTWDQNELFDISKPIPGVQSVPIMCIMIAMYMGFSHIYLLGTDHDVIIKSKYLYPFKPKTLLKAIKAVDENGDIKFDYREMFSSYARLWDQYLALKRIAKTNSIEIVNVTAGGILDVFARTEFRQLF
jgi:hypothetical protein